jgi:hypothetical protein
MVFGIMAFAVPSIFEAINGKMSQPWEIIGDYPSVF